jgi:hypothetical protein
MINNTYAKAERYILKQTKDIAQKPYILQLFLF